MDYDINLLNELFAINQKAKDAAKKYPKKRFIYNEIFSTNKTFIGIAGLRGVGKTTILKQRLIESNNSFYISLDNFKNIDLYKTAEILVEKYDIKELLLDEISYYKDWQKVLKNIYDFIDVKIYFTSSVAIDIIKSKADLSRRVIVKMLYPLSFREYLYFYNNEILDKLDIKDIEDNKKLKKIIGHDYLFKNYISGGLITANLIEKDPIIFSNILDRIIENDLVFTLNFDGSDVVNVKNMLEFIANSTIEDVSYSSISKNVGITKYKAIKYVDALEKAFVLNVIKPKGSNVMKEPKILFIPPFRLSFSKNKKIIDNLGALREEFFVESAFMCGANIFYLKGKRGEKKPDYEFNFKNEKYVFEIGGKNKTRTQLANIVEKNKYILTHPANIIKPYKPLIFVGFL